ncbi:prepilin peptidase [Mannheimia sp. AT1]|uniref:Prepilin peptidase n=1 Tax=Mannheimia cairinae TaxID=3025936 RepID=A0ABT5MLJ5_9PAST|nr:prepilin peptidase [Mannheimia cairinae]MDD0823060.1 prepilin peptidase [Mannheimia cairinae]MDD0825915.1 prepilin peptidase [Mannheimia cairinae]
MFVLISIALAFWFKSEIPNFAHRTNQQIYQEYHSLTASELSKSAFLAQSRLQPKQSKWANLFFLCFPAIAIFSESVGIGLIFIILCYLSVLDYCYYLTDIRYIALIFLLVLWENLNSFHNETLLLIILFCVGIGGISQFIFKKETFGSGDMLLLIALSPLFTVEKMLLFVLAASLLGIGYYLIYWLIQKQKLEKLPFIPFISVAMLIIVMLERGKIS